MLTDVSATDEEFFLDLRAREFARLDQSGVAYLDYTGAALHADSQRRAHDALLARSIFGNPHSAHQASVASTMVLDAARGRVRAMLRAGDDYDVIFTANATAAIKLVAEAYPFGPGSVYALAADNHNSVNGVREYATAAGASVRYLPLYPELRLQDPIAHLAYAGGPRPRLFAFPAQSNFSGVLHPLSLVHDARALGYHVLVDAAAFLPSHDLDLQRYPADFVVLSFYKLFGHPTGLGALVAKRATLELLRRPWFAGGTVEYVSVALRRREFRPSHEGFEDGTPNFLDVAALDGGFAVREAIGIDRMNARVSSLARALACGLASLCHTSGGPLIRIYGPRPDEPRGGVVTFNVLGRNGHAVPYPVVEARANARGVFVRGGCFCNPGAAEAAFRFEPRQLARCLDGLKGRFTVAGLGECLGPETAVGALRASVGIATTSEDLDRLVAVLATFAE